MLGRLPLLAITAAVATALPMSLVSVDGAGEDGSAHATDPAAEAAAPLEGAAPETEAQFENPVGTDEVPNFADPTLIRGRDGYWYAYGTGDPLFQGDDYRKMKIARSDDLVDWEYVGDVFTPETEPRYDGYSDEAFRMYWAPAVEYFDGRYLLYYSYVVNPVEGRQFSAIGVATAPSPAGPWTDSGAAVTGPEQWEPRPGEQAWRNVIDPEVVSTPDGERYLYYGSVNGGVTVAQLSEDGLRVTGERIPVTLENRYEGAHIVYREGYYYLFLSIIGGCCAGPVSAYPVQVARAESPTGPFLDRDGIPVLGRHAGGTPVQVPNGNRWVSVGHNTLATDLAGQQWLVTHGIDRHQPYLQGRLNARVLVLSRLDWVDGWPTANAGQGLLDGPQAAPVADAPVVDSFEAGALSPRMWRQGRGWTVQSEPAGGYLRSPGAAGAETLYATRPVVGDARIRGTLRFEPGTGGSAGFTLDSGGSGELRAVIDRGSGELVLEALHRGIVTDRSSQPLPPNFRHDDWHELDLHLRDGVLAATLSHAGLDDPLAAVELEVPSRHRLSRIGLVTDAAAAHFDDITAAAHHTPVTSAAPDPQVGELDPELSTEFDGELDGHWTPLREPESAVENGVLTLPVDQRELINRRGGQDDPTALLLRDTPEGSWTVETRVTVPFADTFPRSWPQAGLIAYADDDEFVTLTYGAARRTRHVAFGKEMPWQDDVLYGDARLGPTTSDTVWLRLRHTVDAETGEHLYRAGVRSDGEHWVWHGARTLPAGSDPQIALAAFGAAEETDLTAEFDYLRFFRD
ncbi:MAG TPA: family 43 glycosylhydrolase [Candidatus Ruania gallistercoris]|uniref:Family 43 glycosylhydrolase n=1 Tax=Candidatus Ruania gallistercoris TaxID=2838746 RepID=A0A9D2J4Y3_9MICO|nr:family 43 glycosylhydrolase [Candidatus Ruania gallistercoris]